MSASLLKLLNLINRDNGTLHALEDDLKFGTPTTNTNGNGRDTKITISSNNQSKYLGEVVAYYNRLQLPLLFRNISPWITKGEIPAGATTVRDLVPYINTKYGTDFDPEDIVATALGSDEPPFTVKFAATANSLAYVGQIDLLIAPNGVNLPDVFPVTLLNGLDYPNSDTSKGQAAIYSYRFVATGADATFMSNCSVGDVAGEAHRLLLTTLSGDKWLNNGTAADFNLSGSTVVYNGLVSARPATVPNNASYNKVLVLQLGNLCNNFGGLLTIWYS